MVLSICCPELHFVDLRVLQSLYFLLNSMSSFSAASMYGCRSIYLGPHLWKQWMFSLCQNPTASNGSSVWHEPLWEPPRPSYDLYGLIQCKSYIHSEQCSKQSCNFHSPFWVCMCVCACGHVTHNVWVLYICYSSSSYKAVTTLCLPVHTQKICLIVSYLNSLNLSKSVLFLFHVSS